LSLKAAERQIAAHRQPLLFLTLTMPQYSNEGPIEIFGTFAHRNLADSLGG
jgi:hypothetical protein